MFRKFTCILTLISFTLMSTGFSFAQNALRLTFPGDQLDSAPLTEHSIILKGLRVYQDNPFRFDFVLGLGDTRLSKSSINKKAGELARYFLAAITTPETDLWVNLSPYEGDRIIPDAFGHTEMGRDLLAQDYVLKQLTASLMSPRHDLGRKVWKKIRAEIYRKFGTTDVPMESFHKVWIVPDEATVFVSGQTAVIKSIHLKTMLESDYLAERSSHTGDPVNAPQTSGATEQFRDLSLTILREAMLPVIEEEVNNGPGFASLRQIYRAMVFATWFKRNLKRSVMGQIYIDQNKVKGIDLAETDAKDKIWKQYVESFKKGVFDVIQEDIDEETGQVIPRKYFSGGFHDNSEVVHEVTDMTPEQIAATLARGSELAVLAEFNLRPINDNTTMADPGQVTRVTVAPGVLSKGIMLALGLWGITGVVSAQGTIAEPAAAGQALVEPMAQSSVQEIAHRWALDDADPVQRLEGLESLRSPNEIYNAGNRITDMARNDPNPAVRLKALDLIGENSINVQGSVEAALAALKDSDKYLRQSALRAIEAIAPVNDANIIDAVLPFIRAEETRWEAVRALGAIGHGNAKAFSALIRAMNDKNASGIKDILIAFNLNGIDPEPYMKELYEQVLANAQHVDMFLLGAAHDTMTRLSPASPYLLKLTAAVFVDHSWYELLGNGVNEWVAALTEFRSAPKAVRGEALRLLKRIQDLAPKVKYYGEDMQRSAQYAGEELNQPYQGYQSKVGSLPINIVQQDIHAPSELLQYRPDLAKFAENARQYAGGLRSYYNDPEIQTFPDAVVLSMGKVAAFVFLDQYEQGRALDRLAVYVEDARYHGQILSQGRMAKLYAEANKSWLYDGHDYRFEDMARFFNEARSKNMELLPEEIKFRDSLLAMGLLTETKTGYAGNQDMVFISGPLAVSQETREQIFFHELSHAVYFSNVGYRQSVLNVWRSLSEDEQNLVRTILESQGYNITGDPDLLLREFAAYFQDGKSLADLLHRKAVAGIGNGGTALLGALYDVDEMAFAYGGIVRGKPWAKVEQALSDLNAQLQPVLVAAFNNAPGAESNPSVLNLRENITPEVSIHLKPLEVEVGGVGIQSWSYVSYTIEGLPVGTFSENVLTSTEPGLQDSTTKAAVRQILGEAFPDNVKDKDRKLHVQVTGTTIFLIEQNNQGKLVVTADELDALQKKYDSTSSPGATNRGTIVIVVTKTNGVLKYRVYDTDPGFAQRQKLNSGRALNGFISTHDAPVPGMNRRISDALEGGLALNLFAADPDKVGELEAYLKRIELSNSGPLSVAVWTGSGSPDKQEQKPGFYKLPDQGDFMSAYIPITADYKIKELSQWNETDVLNFLMTGTDIRQALKEILARVKHALDSQPPKKDEVGGIDLDPSTLKLTEQGDKTDLTAAWDAEVTGRKIDGVVPVLFRVGPMRDPVSILFNRSK